MIIVIIIIGDNGGGGLGGGRGMSLRDAQAPTGLTRCW